ncbi:multidrug efflux SMR transporter [Bacillus aquiflavi]|uniref:Multidrug efflux SMR transporter n=1 Tax=Bacillus aquiflavi TaxID=2672567 RepID=A0A6B3W3J3_9BACI|nr:multidrug efflux SMR transporter [Bacillus aquiflavi]MBA4537808.1 multidrug efflux SMR transporter [Bacillus aquiflavi]NEY82064.1 multidrug efflux SMR transporter [Bacillus aquiflavi]UAC48365.1 multidrug efflux SMR transporter [Bacillus aquiflavi]
MHWIFLSLAILFEVAGTTAMKLSNGLTRFIPSILMIFFYISSFLLLAIALKTMDVSVAYAVWSGVGIVFITLIGFLLFQEKLNFVKVISILFIVIGVVALNFSGNTHDAKKLETTEENSSSQAAKI